MATEKKENWLKWGIVDAREFCDSLKLVRGSTIKPRKGDGSYYTSCILFEFTKLGVFYLVGTNGHEMTRAKVRILEHKKDDRREFLIDQREARIIVATFKKSKAKIRIEICRKTEKIRFTDVSLKGIRYVKGTDSCSAYMLDQGFPDYRRVMPQETAYTGVASGGRVEVEDLKKALKELLAHTQKYSTSAAPEMVTVSFGLKRHIWLAVSSKGSSFEERKIPVVQPDGPGGAILVRINYLLGFCRRFTEQTIWIEYYHSRVPLVLYSDYHKIEHVIMPVNCPIAKKYLRKKRGAKLRYG